MSGTSILAMVAILGWVLIAFALVTGKLRLRQGPSHIQPQFAEGQSTHDAQAEIPFGEALDTITIGLVIASSDGEIIYRNGLAQNPTGAVHSDLLVEEVIERHLRSALVGEIGQQTLDLYGPPRRVISVLARPLINSGAVIMIEDITERALIDAVRTDFVANISHELKTPVGALAVLAEALCQVDDPEVVQRLSNKIADEAIRAGRTIDDLLELSRIEFGGEAVKDVVDVDVIVAEALGRTQAYSESRSIEVTYEQDSIAKGSRPPLRVRGDRRQLVSALGNLIENAVKYSEAGGRVHLSALQKAGEVQIAVRDFGMGVPAKDIDRIFERFYRVDRARSRETGGTGLGLAIVRHVVSNHGGQVLVVSNEGEGSTFTLTLPNVSTSEDSQVNKEFTERLK